MHRGASVTVQSDIAQTQEQLVSVGSWNSTCASFSDHHDSNQGNGGSSGSQNLTEPDMMQGLVAQADHLGEAMDPSTHQQGKVMQGLVSQANHLETTMDPSIEQQAGVMQGLEAQANRLGATMDPSISAKVAQANRPRNAYAVNSTKPAVNPAELPPIPAPRTELRLSEAWRRTNAREETP